MSLQPDESNSMSKIMNNILEAESSNIVEVIIKVRIEFLNELQNFLIKMRDRK